MIYLKFNCSGIKNDESFTIFLIRSFAEFLLYNSVDKLNLFNTL